MSCDKPFDEETFILFADSELSSPMSEEFKKHIDSCDECREELEFIVKSLQAFRTLSISEKAEKTLKNTDSKKEKYCFEETIKLLETAESEFENFNENKEVLPLSLKQKISPIYPKQSIFDIMRSFLNLPRYTLAGAVVGVLLVIGAGLFVCRVPIYNESSVINKNGAINTDKRKTNHISITELPEPPASESAEKNSIAARQSNSEKSNLLNEETKQSSASKSKFDWFGKNDEDSTKIKIVGTSKPPKLNDIQPNSSLDIKISAEEKKDENEFSRQKSKSVISIAEEINPSQKEPEAVVRDMVVPSKSSDVLKDNMPQDSKMKTENYSKDSWNTVEGVSGESSVSVPEPASKPAPTYASVPEPASKSAPTYASAPKPASKRGPESGSLYGNSIGNMSPGSSVAKDSAVKSRETGETYSGTPAKNYTNSRQFSSEEIRSESQNRSVSIAGAPTAGAPTATNDSDEVQKIKKLQKLLDESYGKGRFYVAKRPGTQKSILIKIDADFSDFSSLRAKAVECGFEEADVVIESTEE